MYASYTSQPVSVLSANTVLPARRSRAHKPLVRKPLNSGAASKLSKYLQIWSNLGLSQIPHLCSREFIIPILQIKQLSLKEFKYIAEIYPDRSWGKEAPKPVSPVISPFNCREWTIASQPFNPLPFTDRRGWRGRKLRVYCKPFCILFLFFGVLLTWEKHCFWKQMWGVIFGCAPPNWGKIWQDHFGIWFLVCSTQSFPPKPNTICCQPIKFLWYWKY